MSGWPGGTGVPRMREAAAITSARTPCSASCKPGYIGEAPGTYQRPPSSHDSSSKYNPM